MCGKRRNELKAAAVKNANAVRATKNDVFIKKVLVTQMLFYASNLKRIKTFDKGDTLIRRWIFPA